MSVFHGPTEKFQLACLCRPAIWSALSFMTFSRTCVDYPTHETNTRQRKKLRNFLSVCPTTADKESCGVGAQLSCSLCRFIIALQLRSQATELAALLIHAPKQLRHNAQAAQRARSAFLRRRS